DYDQATGSLTFGPSETSKTIFVTLTNDTAIEKNEAFTVKLSNPGGKARLGSPDTTTVVIVDSDSTRDQRWVMQAYLDILQRPVDPAGLQLWTGLLAQGYPRLQVVRFLQLCQENATRVVNQEYLKILARPADPLAQQTWIPYLMHGGGAEQMEA